MSAKNEKPKKPTLKQYNESLLQTIEHLQKENSTLRGVSSENYTLKQKLISVEAQRDSAIDSRRNAEAQLNAYEAAAHAWRSAFYAVVLKQKGPTDSVVKTGITENFALGYGSIVGR